MIAGRGRSLAKKGDAVTGRRLAIKRNRRTVVVPSKRTADAYTESRGELGSVLPNQVSGRYRMGATTQRSTRRRDVGAKALQDGMMFRQQGGITNCRRSAPANSQFFRPTAICLRVRPWSVGGCRASRSSILLAQHWRALVVRKGRVGRFVRAGFLAWPGWKAWPHLSNRAGRTASAIDILDGNHFLSSSELTNALRSSRPLIDSNEEAFFRVVIAAAPLKNPRC